MLYLHNDLTGQHERFVAIEPPSVRMYHCGPTVYNYAHIGNLRSYVFADILRRTLEHEGYTPTQVINITDVGHLTDDEDQGEDKVETQAQREHKTADEITRYYTDAFLQDLYELNVRTEGTRFPRATHHISEQIDLIRHLEKKGYTYTTDDGVYFDTAQFSEYGKLGQLDTTGNEEGARVDVNEQKRNPTDFALWKFSPQDMQRQQEWDSPWGIGFPGWHIECSAMAMELLGETLDIHTGGIDHIPVHHNNEIAQSECATGKPFARYWLHNAFVDMKGTKMAKSEGNIVTLRTLKEAGIHPLAYRYWLLTAHYRSPISFDEETVKGAGRALARLADQLADMPTGGSISPAHQQQITDALRNDLDTPRVIAAMWETLGDQNMPSADKRATVEHAIALLGIDPYELRSPTLPKNDLPRTVSDLVEKREEARTQKDFAQADILREQIQDHGYDVQDTESGPRISKREL